jgi:F0F1-type ATP synthase gamma subunit
MTKRTLYVESQNLKALKTLVETYEELAAMKMQRVRKDVMSSRQFADGLASVLVEVESNYRGILAKEKKAQSEMYYTTINRNGKSVAVFLASDQGLYGDIVYRIYDKFIDFVQKNETDIVVLGKLGAKIVSQRNPDLLYNFYDFADDSIHHKSLSAVMRYLLQFEKIFVFSGKMESLVSQVPTVTNISGEKVDLSTWQKQKITWYLFEPSLEKMLSVFEGEILASVFEQSIHESQLAKFASRLINLDRSVESIDDKLKGVSIQRRRLAHKLGNKKQLSALAGISLWQ